MNSYVNDFNENVKFYFQELNKYKPLTKEEERELIKRVKENNDTRARDKILTSNLRFVFEIAKNYKGCGVPIGDLIAEGNIGLIKALDKFNLEYDIKLISYGIWWIRQAMQRCIKERNRQNKFEFPEEEELNKKIVNLSSMCDEEDETLYTIDVIESNEEEEERRDNLTYNRQLIQGLINKLDERERYIISLYYGLDGKNKTLEEIANIINLSKERIRQIKEKSLKKLRSEMLILTD